MVDTETQKNEATLTQKHRSATPPESRSTIEKKGDLVNESKDKTVTVKLKVWRELKRICAEEELSISEVIDKLLKEAAKRKDCDGEGSETAGSDGE
ncbi:hypothetical protein D3C78_1645360 [compost metagenome]